MDKSVHDVRPTSPNRGKNYSALIHLPIDQTDMQQAYERSTWGDEFKRKIRADRLLDLPTFKQIHDIGLMHDTVTFIEYRQEQCESFGFEKDVGIHRDGGDNADRFHVSMIYPIRLTDDSYISWYEGSEAEYQVRTGTFCSEEEKLYEVDRYYFYDDQTYPVMFRVDEWHGVKLGHYGRTLMRWLFRSEVSWEQALLATESWMEPLAE